MAGDDALGISRLFEAAAVAAKARGETVLLVALEAGMPALAQILGAVERSAPGYLARPDSLEAGADSGVSFAAMLQALDAIRSRGRTAVLAIEGAEAMDAGEIEVLSRASRRFAGSVAVLVGCRTPRGGTAARWPIDGFGLVEVAALSEREVELALRAHFGVNALPDGLAEEYPRHLGRSPGAGSCPGRPLGRRRRALPVGARFAGAGLGPRGAPAGGAGGGGRREGESPEPGGQEILNLMCLGGGRLPIKAVSEFHRPADPRPAVEELVGAGLAGVLDERTSLGLG